MLIARQLSLPEFVVFVVLSLSPFVGLRSARRKLKLLVERTPREFHPSLHTSYRRVRGIRWISLLVAAIYAYVYFAEESVRGWTWFPAVFVFGSALYLLAQAHQLIREHD